MFTSIDKAIAAFLSSAIFFAALFWPGITQYVTPDILAIVGTLVTAIITWAVPNKPKIE